MILRKQVTSSYFREGVMEDHHRQRIQRYLQDEEVQKNIARTIRQRREQATVSIGRAAQLYNFNESKLREMETIGLLKPMRRDGNTSSKGQRQYPLSELDKLAIIQELMEGGNFSASDIPPDILEIWSSFAPPEERAAPDTSEVLPIDQRVIYERELLFWRFYATQALRMSLMLIREVQPDTTIGLLLPFRPRTLDAPTPHTDNLSSVGEALIGWLDRQGMTQIMFTPSPSFRYPKDYWTLPLVAMTEERYQESLPGDTTLLILEHPRRRVQRLTLSSPSVKLIRRLLAPLYEEIQHLRACFGPGWRDIFEPATDLDALEGYQDTILAGLADMIIRLGGTSPVTGKNRWKFSLITAPASMTSTLPLQQRSLIARARSKDCPYLIGESVFSPEKSKTSIGIRALQSGHIIYRPDFSLGERTQKFVAIEGHDIRSNIAIPIGAENGQPVAVLYVASSELDAFPKEDRPLLRIMGRIIEYLLRNYQNRLLTGADLKSLMNTPGVVDTLFGEFLSENDFMAEVEATLATLQKSLEAHKSEHAIEDFDAIDEISFIGIDIDDQEKLANLYGDQTIRYLNKAIGVRIQELIPAFVTKSTNCQFYYMYGDRFYLILRNISLEKALEKAEQYRLSLGRGISIKHPDGSESVFPDITVHLAVTSYKRDKLEEFLQEYPSIAGISAMIYQALDTVLKLGIEEGGNVVMAWQPDKGAYGRWSPEE
jgi:GGDEF domain-containing protein